MPKCEECGKEFSTDGALAQHLKDKHGIEGKSGNAVPGQGPKAVRKQKSLRKRNRHPVAVGLIAVAVVAGIGLYLVVAPSFASPPYDCIAEQNYYIHVHPYLQITINGNPVTVPDGVGVLQGGGCLEPIHTHDGSGVLHVELSQAESGRNWTLGDFFTIWRFTCQQLSSECPGVNGNALPASSVVFNSTDILGYHSDSTHKVQLLINGTSSSQWGSLNLEAYAYCTAARAGSAPCHDTAGGDPAWDCVTATQCGTYPYPTGNEIVIEYATT